LESRKTKAREEDHPMGSDTPKPRLGKVIQIDEGQLKDQLGALVRESVEDTLNGMLEAEADRLCQAKRYERSAERASTRAGHYERKLQTKAGEVTLQMPKLRSVPFETAIIERYRRRESSVEEALIEMYLAGVSVRRVEDITEALWGTRVSPSTVSKLNEKIYTKIDAWRTRPLSSPYPYVFLDGIWLKRSWGGEVRNVSILVAIAVAEDGFREVIGAVEGAKEDTESWAQFLRHLKERGLKGVRLIISDKCLGLVEALGDSFPDARWQRCVVHFYRNVFSVVPRGRIREVAVMLKAIHAQEDRREAMAKAQVVVKKLALMKLKKAADTVQEGVAETVSYYEFPREHWRNVKTNNPLERILREVRRRTRVVGAFPDGHSALMLVAARLRHIAGTKWGTKKYVDTRLLNDSRKERTVLRG
jgi:putative transposase